MPAIDFLSDNEARGYPFLETSELSMTFSGGGDVELPNAAIVDVTFLLGPQTDFDESEDSVYLYEISRAGDRLRFRFRFTASQLNGYEIEFCRTTADPEYATSQSDIPQGNQSTSLGTACEGLIAEGWLTTGRLETLFDILADGQWLRRADADLLVEPARVQSLVNTYINSVSVANQDRVRIATEDCVVSSSASIDDFTASVGDVDRDYIVNAVCLTGPLRLRAGFNTNLQQDDLSNTITIGGQIGGGLGEPCGEIAIYDGEVPPPGSNFLSGGPGCENVIKTINGIGGPHVLFQSGLGVRVEADETTAHKLLIDIDLHGLAICAES